MARFKRRYGVVVAENVLIEVGKKAAEVRRSAQALTPDAPRLYESAGEIHAAVARLLIRGEDA